VHLRAFVAATIDTPTTVDGRRRRRRRRRGRRRSPLMLKDSTRMGTREKNRIGKCGLFAY
jgi:hypothetical protein